MRRMKKVVSLVLVLMLIITLMPVNANAAVKLNVTEKTIAVGESVTLKVTGTAQKVTWKSSNKKVVTVTKKGKVTGKKEGKATISAKVGKKTLKCKITVQGKEGMRPEFKEAMDGYETFFNEVYDLMNALMENPSDLSLLVSLQEKALMIPEMTEEFQAWSESEMSLEEAVYYMEVATRISKKLLEIQQKLESMT